MIKSMTGFGSTDLVLGGYHHRIEVRSVNSKFCDVKVKTPLDLTSLDIRTQQHVKKQFARGHFEVMFYRNAPYGEASWALEVNWDLAEAYYKTYQSIRRKFGISHDVNLSMISNAREVISVTRQSDDTETIWLKAAKALDVALESVKEMRKAEGKSLAVDLAGRCNKVRGFITEIDKLSPVVVDSYRVKLKEKINQISTEAIDETRLAQEVCIFADRCDITEEIIRLKSHIQQFLHFLDSEDPVGRKLDFLVQEMNRETNTIGSKSNSAEIAHIVVEIKSELEKLREQIQNVE